MKRTIHDTPQRVSYDGQFGTVTGHAGYIGGRRELQPDVIYDVEWLIGGTDELAGNQLTEVSEGAYAAEVADFRMWQASHDEYTQPEAGSERVAALERACAALVGIYARSAGSIDWSELDHAHELAALALEVK